MKFSLPANTPPGQREAIEADDKNITVSAGAGTGKTWVLSGRYARLLIDNQDLKPADILTLTYTEAAAADMKVRIIERLEQELKDTDDSDRKNKILEGLSDTWISTIHAFAARLIRESGLSLDIDPAASVITPQQEQEFWEGIRNAVAFSRLRELARTYGNETLRKAAEFLDKDKFMTDAVNKWGSDKLSDLAQSVAELHASSGNTWENMLAWSDDDILIGRNSDASKKIQAILINEWREVWDFFKDIDLPEAKNPDGPGGRLNALLNWQKSNSRTDIKVLKFFYDSLVIDAEKNLSNGRGGPFTTFKEIYGKTLTEWRNSRPKILKEISRTFDKDFSVGELFMRRTLLKFCAVSWGMWDTMKQRRGLLSFSDMILHARGAVENKSVRREFKHILVDEFQDTDPLQFEMINALKENLDSSLFAVGDPKQSIYKFRYADLKLFAKMINDEKFRRISLDVSFRTRKTLLEKINKIFASLWRKGLGKSDATLRHLKFEGLDAAVNYDTRDSGSMPDFEIFLAHNGENLASTREILAEELALNISKWVNEGRTIWDKDAKKIRPVKFSDFTVLTRARGVYANIEKSFEKFNIPSIRDRSADFFTRGEIGDVVCMLRAAADFGDSFSVMGWLMSPFSGAAEDEVINKIFVNSGKKKNLLELLKNNLPETYSRLEYLSLIGECEGPAAVLEFFDRDRRWLSCYRQQDRLRVLRNFRLALSMSRSFQQSGTSSLTACAEWLTRAVKRELKIEEPKWHDESENAVNLTAVHSSKGLEYPVTIIFDTQKSKRVDNEPLKASLNLGLVFSKLPDEFETDEEPRLINWEKVLSAQGDLEEEERLFYVAATRAQDSLIFCGMLDAKDGKAYKNSWTEFLLENIDEETKQAALNPPPAYEAVLNRSENEAEILPEKVINEEIEADLIPRKIIRAKNSLRQISASAFSLFEWCPFAWRRRYRQGLTLIWDLTDRELEDGSPVGGADLGSLAHWILSRWPSNENFESELEYYLNDREMIALLPAYLRDVWRNKNKKSMLREWLLKFAASESGFILRSRQDIKREYRFTSRLDSQTALAGAIDAIYENNIIDYKITSIDNAPKGLYDSQLDFYAFVAHELTGHKEIKTTTAFLREGIFSERVCKDFDDIKARISNAAESCASGNLNPKREHCGECPFKKGCAFVK